MEQSIDYQEILTLTENGYTVTFEASGIGDYFCLLRRVATQELVNCTIGNSFGEALAGAAEWDKSDRPGNGTAPRPTAAELATGLSETAAKLADAIGYGRDTRRELLAIIGDLRTQLADHTTRLGGLENLAWHHPSFIPAPTSNPYPAPGNRPSDH
jgi:hypothetical protein